MSHFCCTDVCLLDNLPLKCIPFPCQYFCALKHKFVPSGNVMEWDPKFTSTVFDFFFLLVTSRNNLATSLPTSSRIFSKCAHRICKVAKILLNSF